MVSMASLLGARHLWEVVKNKPASSLLCPWARHLTRRPTFMWKTGDPEMATPKRVRTFRPKHSDTSLSREWRINKANKKKKKKASRNKFVEKSEIPDRAESFREVDSSKSCLKARFELVKPIQNELSKEQNLIESRPSRDETGLGGVRK